MIKFWVVGIISGCVAVFIAHMLNNRELSPPKKRICFGKGNKERIVLFGQKAHDRII